MTVPFSSDWNWSAYLFSMSRSQGYLLLRKAWAEIKDDIDKSGIDRQELLS